MRTEGEIIEIYERHVKMVYRVCFAYMKNAAETEDAVQETFFRLIRKGPRFESAEHEKAWLIRTASNVCKNVLKHPSRKHEDIEEHAELRSDDRPETQRAEHPEVSDVLRAITELPDKYKPVIYLYYYEGYDSAQIARLLQKPKSTIRSYLSEARSLLKERLGDDYEK
ncbi:MAG: RNA polymerase sigma factor [Lachnospiraceae bacterium]|nr:RNA polymerase sigma factor [Lachnospiraceae bacterium]